MKKVIFGSLLFALVALLASNALAGRYYKWVDEEGVVHYSDSAPENEQASEKWIDTGGAAPAQAGAGSGAASPGAPSMNSESNSQSDTPTAISKKTCQTYQHNLEVLKNKSQVRMKDPETGQVKTLDAKKQKQLIKKYKNALQACRYAYENLKSQE